MQDVIDRIRARYDEDKAVAREARALDEIPFSYEMIGPDWMTAVLCRSVPGARVTKVTLGEADEGTSSRRAIYLEYNEAGARAGLPRSVFCKSSHSVLHRINLGLSGAAFSEVTFYNTLRPLVEVDAPEPYFANFDPETFNSIIVLRNMEEEVEFCRHWTPISREQIRSQLDLISTFHARFLEDAEINARTVPLATWSKFYAAVESYGHEAATNEGFLLAEEVIPARLYKRFPEVWPAQKWANDLHDRLPATLIHGDCHLKQWYIRRSTGGMGLTDWQCASFGHWSRDLAYMTATSLTVEDRRAWDRELVAEYIEMMKSKGVDMPSFDETFLRYRQGMVGSLSWWTGTLAPTKDQPDMQPRDTTMEFIKRLAHAVDDLDGLDVCCD